MNKNKPSKCPICGDTKVQLYDISDISNTVNNIYICHKCHHLWNDEQKLIEYKPTFNIFNMKKLKESRKLFNYLGKIKDDDIANIIIDLYEYGGNTFYKEKKIKKKK